MIPGIVAGGYERPAGRPSGPAIGEPYGGGFYAGDIEIEGQWYCLIVADISADTPKRWKETNTATTGTDHLTDGAANTAAMLSAGIPALHPAAAHCVDYSGAGHTDWYMPSREELNLIYTNLGLNQPSSPPEFQWNGAQAFNPYTNYWSSTQAATTTAHSKSFTNGNWNSASKQNSRRVRPIRRLALTP